MGLYRMHGGLIQGIARQSRVAIFRHEQYMTGKQ